MSEHLTIVPVPLRGRVPAIRLRPIAAALLACFSVHGVVSHAAVRRTTQPVDTVASQHEYLLAGGGTHGVAGRMGVSLPGNISNHLSAVEESRGASTSTLSFDTSFQDEGLGNRSSSWSGRPDRDASVAPSIDVDEQLVVLRSFSGPMGVSFIDDQRSDDTYIEIADGTPSVASHARELGLNNAPIQPLYEFIPMDFGSGIQVADSNGVQAFRSLFTTTSSALGSSGAPSPCLGSSGCPVLSPGISPVAPLKFEASETTKPIVVITHGWQPFGSSENMPEWMTEMKNAIGNNATVKLKKWDAAFTEFNLISPEKGFQAALAEVSYQGRALGRELVNLAKKEGSQVLDNLQFIGHSLGTLVNAYAADVLTSAGYKVKHFTILDRPFGNGLGNEGIGINETSGISGIDTRIFQSLLRKGEVEFVENYYGNDISFKPFQAYGASFAGQGPTAYNRLINGANHSEVHQWYQCTIDTSSPECDINLLSISDILDGGGYDWSPTGDSPELRPKITWNPGKGVYPTTSQKLDVTDWLLFNCAILNNNAFCEEGSPAFLWNDAFFVPVGSEFISFDFRWLNLGDGDYLSLFFNDTLLFNFQGTEFYGEDFLSSGLIPIGAFAGQTGQLLFALNSVGEANASYEIGNLQIIGRSVPESSTLALLGLCLAGLAATRRRR